MQVFRGPEERGADCSGKTGESHICSEKQPKSIRGHAHEPCACWLRNGIPVARSPKIGTNSSRTPLDVEVGTTCFAQSSTQN